MTKAELLILEDSRLDAEIVIHTLNNSGFSANTSVAGNKTEFVQAITTKKFDAILADNQLLKFNATEALQIMQHHDINVPFILVTGSISDEYAADMMSIGVTDYVLKDRLQRLPNAVRSAIQKYSLEKERDKYMSEVLANDAIMLEAARIAHFGSWEVNFAHKTVRWSDEQYRILGYTPGEVEPTIDNLLKMVHPDDFETTRMAVNKAFKYATRQNFDSRVIRKDGTVIYVAGALVSTCDEKGTVLRINGFTQDVTRTREAELAEKKITADLIQRNKDLEQFAYIISHNLRSPVANIVGLTNQLCDEETNPSDQAFFIGAISTSVKKLENVITDLNNILQVTHHVNENKEPVSFAGLVEEIKSGLGQQIAAKSVIIQCDFSQLAEWQTLRSYMRSIFFNLVSNSIKFCRPGTTPKIRIESYSGPDGTGLIFTDNGIGIDLGKNESSLFGLYRRFNPDYAEGRGVGLFMVKSQVETLGGRIHVKSKVNEGTAFHIEFGQ